MLDMLLPLDAIILGAEHEMAIVAGGLLTPLCKGITFLGAKGAIMLAIGIILFFRKDTRKYSIAIIGAVACAFLFNDIIIKPIVMRVRPFEASEIFRSYWESAGKIYKDGYSFPSGHVSGISAGCFAFVFMLKKDASKKYLVIAIIAPIIMAFSRTYLMHHYPSDCIFGFLSGIIYGLVASIITKYIYVIMKKYKDMPLFDFVLNFAPFKK